MTAAMKLALLVAAAPLAAGAGCKGRGAAAKVAKADAAEKAEKRSTGEGGEERGEKPDRVELSEEALAELRLVYARVEERELAPSLEVAAELVPDPDRRALVGSRVGARVVDYRVKVGDRVQRGSPLVVLESAEVGRARAALVAASAKAEVARQAHERERSLIEANATSRREVEEAQAASKTAEAEERAARTLLLAFGASEGDGAADPARLVLRSPIAGIVVARGGSVGQTVDPAAVLAEVIDLDRLWLEAQVYEKEMRFVAPGQPVQVEARGYPGEVFQGKVDRVGDVLDEKTRAVKIRVALANPGHRLKPGMFATARIVGTRARDSRKMVAIPWAAIQEVDGHQAVFVREGERAFELRRVHTGERAADLVEVLNGLRVGEAVVGEGSFVLKGELLKSTLGEEE